MSKRNPSTMNSFIELCEQYELVQRFIETVSGYTADSFKIEDDGEQFILHDKQGMVLLGFNHSGVNSKPWFYGVKSYAYFNLDRWEQYYQNY